MPLNRLENSFMSWSLSISQRHAGGRGGGWWGGAESLSFRALFRDSRKLWVWRRNDGREETQIPSQPLDEVHIQTNCQQTTHGYQSKEMEHGPQYFRAQNGPGLGAPRFWFWFHHVLAMGSYAGHFSGPAFPFSEIASPPALWDVKAFGALLTVVQMYGGKYRGREEELPEILQTPQTLGLTLGID